MNKNLTVWQVVIALVSLIIVGIIGSTMMEVGASQVDNAIRIANPANGSTVSSPVPINGAISGKMPMDSYVWVVVNPETLPGQFWPQGGSHIKPIDGKWSILSYLGGKKGDKSNIMVIVVDKSTDKAFTNWANEGRAKASFSSMKLPENAKIVDKIIVIKK